MQGNSVTVITAVYGSEFWDGIAQCAKRSVIRQTVTPEFYSIIRGADIIDSRNNALMAETEWIIILDADDEFDVGYIESMKKKALEVEGDIFVPAVHKYYAGGQIDTDQTHYQPKDLMTGNYIVVSAMIRTSLFKQLGGFHDYDTLEDWDLWLRAEEAGARFVQCPDAILKVHKRFGSRNSNKSFNEILENAKHRRGII